MSGIDALAAFLSNATVATAEAALLEAALDLAVPGDVLQAQISVGDRLAGTILPPQNGQDLIDILGVRVAALLPADVRPGDRLVLQVTAIVDNKIVVRNLGLEDPQNPVPPRAATASPNAPQAPVSPAREALIAASVRNAIVAKPSQPSHAAPVQRVAAAVQRVIRTAGDLLKAARVPDTAFTRTAAAIAQQAPTRLPAVLQRLEASLPRESQDPRIPTLRTLIAFTARMNPQNEETLATQIASYVSHVLEGAEAKVQQLLQAHVAAQAPDPQPAESAPVPPQSDVPLRAALQPPQARVAPESPKPQASSVARARVAERAAAVEHELKSVVLSLLREPPADRTPSMAQALNETLITLTGTQLNVLSSQAQDPSAISFTIPLYYYAEGKPSQIRISRDAQSGAALNADSFHIAFVLDTANLGTVAIELESSGRSVKVNVKTQEASSATRFSDTLHSLRERLERLRYRVVSAGARALRSAPAAPAVGTANAVNDSGVDLQA